MTNPDRRLRVCGGLIAKKLFQLFASGILARVAFIFRHELPFDEVEVLAKIPGVLFLNWFGATITTLMRHSQIVAGAVQADAQIGAATMARFAPAWLPADRPFPSAFVTMTRHRFEPPK